jgi:hypothetical protein
MKHTNCSPTAKSAHLLSEANAVKAMSKEIASELLKVIYPRCGSGRTGTMASGVAMCAIMLTYGEKVFKKPHTQKVEALMEACAQMLCMTAEEVADIAAMNMPGGESETPNR